MRIEAAGDTAIFLGEEDVTQLLRASEVEANVSGFSALPAVREAMVAQQREFAREGNVVLAGRDIGTVVLPDADLKVYLVASAEERARRRFEEILARGESADYKEILAKVIERDRIDSTRDVAPLRPAEDAVLLDSDPLTADEVFEKVLALCE